jgi:hypothetical protein
MIESELIEVRIDRGRRTDAEQYAKTRTLPDAVPQTSA